MRQSEKINFLIRNHYQQFVDTYKEVDNEFQEKYRLFCICGTLNTGLHEMRCNRARDYKEKQTIKRLSKLLPKK